MLTTVFILTSLWAADCGFRTLPIQEQLVELRNVKNWPIESLAERVQVLTEAAPESLRPHARDLKGLAIRLSEPLTRAETAYPLAEKFIPFYDRVAEFLSELESVQVRAQKLSVRFQKIRMATGDEKYEGFRIAAREALELAKIEGVWSDFGASALFDLIYQTVWRLPQFDQAHRALIVTRLSEVARQILVSLERAFVNLPRPAQEIYVRHIEEIESLPELRGFPEVGKAIREFWTVIGHP